MNTINIIYILKPIVKVAREIQQEGTDLPQLDVIPQLSELLVAKFP